MGWCKLTDENGQINCEVTGDSVWGIMGKAMEDLRDCYIKEIGRRPTKGEMRYALEWCKHSVEEYGVEYEKIDPSID